MTAGSAQGAAPAVAGRGDSRAHELLARADSELLAAQFSAEAWEQFSHAHLSALRAGAAVLAVRGTPAGRRAPRTVWGLLEVVAPELDAWTAHFAHAARLRSAAEAGRFDLVSGERAEHALATAEDFLDVVRPLVEGDGDGAVVTRARPGTAPRVLHLRAS